jgi:hypothetical protein
MSARRHGRAAILVHQTGWPRHRNASPMFEPNRMAFRWSQPAIRLQMQPVAG